MYKAKWIVTLLKTNRLLFEMKSTHLCETLDDCECIRGDYLAVPSLKRLQKAKKFDKIKSQLRWGYLKYNEFVKKCSEHKCIYYPKPQHLQYRKHVDTKNKCVWQKFIKEL